MPCNSHLQTPRRRVERVELRLQRLNLRQRFERVDVLLFDAAGVGLHSLWIRY